MVVRVACMVTPNENKMGDGWWDCALLGFLPSYFLNLTFHGCRPFARIAWLGLYPIASLPKRFAVSCQTVNHERVRSPGGQKEQIVVRTMPRRRMQTELSASNRWNSPNVGVE